MSAARREHVLKDAPPLVHARSRITAAVMQAGSTSLQQMSQPPAEAASRELDRERSPANPISDLSLLFWKKWLAALHRTVEHSGLGVWELRVIPEWHWLHSIWDAKFLNFYLTFCLIFFDILFDKSSSIPSDILLGILHFKKISDIVSITLFDMLFLLAFCSLYPVFLISSNIL